MHFVHFRGLILCNSLITATSLPLIPSAKKLVTTLVAKYFGLVKCSSGRLEASHLYDSIILYRLPPQPCPCHRTHTK
jgi:hypothetical protein